MHAIPGELLDIELFGFEKGAFMGGLSEKTGKFELVNGGGAILLVRIHTECLAYRNSTRGWGKYSPFQPEIQHLPHLFFKITR